MNLARINTILVIAIISVNCYIIVTPFVPGVAFWLQQRDGTRQVRLEKSIAKPPRNDNTTPVSQGDRLIIPAMLLDESVHTGKTVTTLRKGLWLRPTGSTPDKGSNTIIVGHRFTYTNPRGSLYHLDKVTIGDRIGLVWQGKQYRYRVSEVKVVRASATYIEAPTNRPQLTIYTCTPLWLPKDRLVVIAQEES